MINFDGKELVEEFNKVFGNLIIGKVEELGVSSPVITPNILSIDKLTLEQLWWLVKFAKHVRGRCRNNAAFNNYMNRNFPNAKFREVPKEYNGKHYMGLQIEVDGQTSEGDESVG